MRGESITVKASAIILRAMLLAASLLLTLSSCGIAGIFPDDLVQMTQRIDLSAEITAADAGTFQLAILKLLGTEYVLLFSSASSDPSQTHLFVLSPTLEVQDRYTKDAIDTTVSPSGTPFQGTAAVTRLLDNTIIIGNVVATAASAGLVLASKLPVSLWGTAIVGPSPGGITLTGFSVGSSGNFSCQVYDSSWAPIASTPHPVGGAVYFRGAFTDPEDDQSNTAFLVFEDTSTNTDSFVQVPKVPDLAGGWPSSAPILGNPEYPVFTKTNMDGASINVTAQGIVGYDYSSQSWIRFLPSSPDAVKSLSVGSRNGSEITAFSYSGGYFCIFDPATRALTRYEKWW